MFDMFAEAVNGFAHMLSGLSVSPEVLGKLEAFDREMKEEVVKQGDKLEKKMESFPSEIEKHAKDKLYDILEDSFSQGYNEPKEIVDQSLGKITKMLDEVIEKSKFKDSLAKEIKDIMREITIFSNGKIISMCDGLYKQGDRDYITKAVQDRQKKFEELVEKKFADYEKGYLLALQKKIREEFMRVLEKTESDYTRNIGAFIELVVGKKDVTDKSGFSGRLKLENSAEAEQVRQQFTDLLKDTMKNPKVRNFKLVSVVAEGNVEQQERFISSAMRELHKAGVFKGHAKFKNLGFEDPLTSFAELVVAAFLAVCGDSRAWNDWWAGRTQMEVTDLKGFKGDLEQRADLFNQTLADVAKQKIELAR